MFTPEEIIDDFGEYRIRDSHGIFEGPCSAIIHLSDLHFGPKPEDIENKTKNLYQKYGGSDLKTTNSSAKTNLRTFVRKAREYFDVKKTIITGDLTTIGDYTSFNNVEDFISNVNKKRGLGINSKEIMIVPGNHDVLEERFSLKNWIFDKKPPLANFNKAFDGWNSGYPDHDYIDLFNGREALICCFDSTRKDIPTSLSQISGGMIDNDKCSQLYQELTLEDNARFNAAFKIAVLHHHPLPLPSGSSGRQYYYLMLENGAEFLKFLVDTKFDMVLHGHEHETCYYSISYKSNQNPNDHTTFIVSGGTATQGGEQERCFNLILFYESGAIKVIKKGTDNKHLSGALSSITIS